MEGALFDSLTRQVTTRLTRRTGLRLLAILGVPGLTLTALAEPKKKKKGKNKNKKKKAGGKQGGCQAGTKQCGNRCIPNSDCCTTADCTGTDLCENGACVALRCGNGGVCTVFMTNAGFVGTQLGGLNGADSNCQNAATAAGLTGSFRAWLSAGTDNPANRFTNLAKAGPYQLVPNALDGVNPPPKVADSFADVTTCDGAGGQCLQNAINRTETGVDQGGSPGVWTGTLADGTTATDTCGGWTAAGTGGNGTAGIGTAANQGWTNAPPFPCSSPLPLYCFQQAT